MSKPAGEKLNDGIPTLEWIDALREVLPLQNPLHSFVHNNMLQAWEGGEFWEATAKAARLYRARFPRALDYYQREWKKGRIHDQAVAAEIRRQLPSLPERWLSALLMLLREARDFAADALVRNLPRDISGGEKLQIVHYPSLSQRVASAFPDEFGEWFCILCETFLDQGLAHWPNPFRRDSLRRYATELLESAAIRNFSWRGGLLDRLGSSLSSEEIILEELKLTGLNKEKEYQLVLETCFAFKGWVGLINKLEREPHWFPFNHTTAKLTDAIALLLTARRLLNIPLPRFEWDESPDEVLASPEALNRAGLAVNARWEALSLADWQAFIPYLNQFDSAQCGRLLHEAFERTLHDRFLSAISTEGRYPMVRAKPPRYQILTCMDDRTESLRRHLEDISDEVATFGVLGNFNLDMKFLAWDSPTTRRQCPPVVTPRRTLVETPPKVSEQRGALNYSFYRAWRNTFHARVFRSAGSLSRGFLASTLYGPLSALVLGSRTLTPGLWTRAKAMWEAKLFRRTPGEIDLKRSNDAQYGEMGYTVEEQAEIVSQVLKPLCPPSQLAPIVLCVAHQATTTNNPFQQAYGCGACGGNGGSPNARIFCDMANSPEVRQVLKTSHDFAIPSATHFVPAIQDTTTDTIELLSAEPYPELRSLLDKALERNALERCAFFAAADEIQDSAQALQHVRFRSWNLGEPRPEYGHSRIALAVFGRRELTQNLCLDRRAFLVSYDRKLDSEDGKILTGLIHGALPVAANIGLDYFFSSIDPHGFGAGSKLPLNISALVGAVSGSRGDVRIGLATQMIEIHEPVRVMAIIEAENDLVFKTVVSHRRLKRLIENGWMRVIAMDPVAGTLSEHIGGQWHSLAVPPLTASPASSWLENQKKDPALPWSNASSLERIWRRAK